MKKIYKPIVFWMILVSLCFSSCSSGGRTNTSVSISEGKCRDFICVEISITEPIILNQPTNVTINIRSTKNQPNLVVSLITSPGGNVEFSPERVWNFDAQADQDLTFTSSITFTAPGGWQVAAQVGFVQGGFIVEDFDRVIIDEDGTAHLNPTPGPHPTSDVLQPASPDPQMLTATAAAEPTLPKAVGFTPQELIEKCGWSVDQPENLADWADIRIAFDLPEVIAVDQKIEEDYVIGYDDMENSQAILPVHVGLCPFEGWVADGPSIWEHELQSGVALTNTVQLHFPKPGTFPMMLVVLDKLNQRISSVGMLVQVLSSDDYQDYQDRQLLPTESTSELSPDMGVKYERSSIVVETNGATPQWRIITQETYDTTSWPAGSPLWEVRDTTNDQLDRKWGVRSEEYAARPAAGGAAGLSYLANYPNNYSSEMIVGPIDCRSGTDARVTFIMNIDTQANYDYLYLYASATGNDTDWHLLDNWSGTSNNSWITKQISINSYRSQSTYLKWRFVSDNSIVARGVAIDNVRIEVLPGTITTTGTITYTDRNGTSGKRASYMNVQLWDWDNTLARWALLAETSANSNGYFQFPSIENWDDDPYDPDRRLDLEVLYETVYHKGQSDEQIVTKINDDLYRWPNDAPYIRYNVPNGTFSASKVIPADPEVRAKALWAFQDMMRLYNATPGTKRSGHIHWEAGVTCIDIGGFHHACDSAFFIPVLYPDGVFLPDNPQSIGSQDIVVHEMAHQYMKNSIGFWYPTAGALDTFTECVLTPHYYFNITTPVCAYTEGWADYVAVAVNKSLNSTDHCLDWNHEHCGSSKQSLEDPYRLDGQNLGDSVEGRIAGSLWDLNDSINEGVYDSLQGMDRSIVDFSTIWTIMEQTGGLYGYNMNTFWLKSRDYINKHSTLQTFYRNSIDYDTAPFLSTALPSVSALQGALRDNAIDLWVGYFRDNESTVDEMTYTVSSGSSNCVVRIDGNRYIDIDQRTKPSFYGNCNITVRAYDGIKAVSGTFTLSVLQIRGRNFLPVVFGGTDSGTTAMTIETPSVLDSSSLYGYPAPMESSNYESKQDLQDLNGIAYPAP